MSDARSTRRRGMSFGFRLALGVLAVAVVPLILLGGIIASQLRRSLTEQVNSGLASDADAVQQLVEQGLTEREKNVKSCAEDAIVRGGLLFSTFEKSNQSLKTLRERYPMFRALVLFDPTGRAVAASDPEVKRRFDADAAAVAAAPWFRAALRGATQTEPGPTMDSVLGERVLHFAALVLSPNDGSPMGVVLAAQRFDEQMNSKVEAVIDRAAARGHKSFEVIAALPDGTVIFDSNATRGRPDLPQDVVRGILSGVGDRGVAQVGPRVAAIEKNDPGARADWLFLAVVDSAETYAPVQRGVWLTGALVVVFGAAAVIVSLLIARSTVRPVLALNSAVDRVVREGDLTQNVAVESRDEIGELAATFSKMIARLREIPESLRESTHLLTDAVSNLAASTNEQSESIARQAAALQETQVTMQEIRQTSLVAAQKAQAVLEVAERADEIGKRGENAIAMSLGGLTDIREQVLQISTRIAELTERTQQIGFITGTVKDLADQSNMLALNAAIEAVRSGEHGRGFAVVAREIRSLADQSIQATKRVREILDDITAAIRSAVSITERGADRIEAGLVQMRSSGENLRQLSTIVKDNSAAVRQIAAAVAQQNAGISQISSAVSDLNELMENTVARLKGTTEANAVLREVSARVADIVKSYKI